jgi:hypothetical protein
VSRANGNSPNWFGPWVPLFNNFTQNTDIVDVAGTKWDLYRVQPILQAFDLAGNPQAVTLDMSRPFYAWQPLYDMQMSALIDNFRNNWIKDAPIPQTESTIPSESTGGNVQPFITDASTKRFFLSFLPNDDPIKPMARTTQVYLGQSEATAAPLEPYQDFYVNEDGGYIEFNTIPPVTSYLRCEFEKVQYTDDQIRNVLTNAISDVSNYGINGYQINVSNNLYYLATPLPNRDLAEIICSIAYIRLLNQSVLDATTRAEEWKDGNSGVEFTSDPSRTLQAAVQSLNDMNTSVQQRANTYIYNTRNYIAYGEFDSFFDVSGVLPLYTLIVAGTNLGGAMGWWL